MTDLAKILVENQKEMMKMIAPAFNEKTIVEAISDTESVLTDEPLSLNVEELKHDFEQVVREHPIKSVAVGFAVGFLLSRILR